MTIWVGHDGTLNDDDGDGPAVAGDPMETLGVGYDGWDYEMPYEYVGQDDASSALGSIGSALGSAFGGDSGSGGGGGGGGSGGGSGGFDFSSLASSFGSALGGSQGGGGGGGAGSDTGSAIANIFGQVAKVAVPAATQAISNAAQSHPQAQAQTAPPAVTAVPAVTAPAQKRAPVQGHPAGTHHRQQHAVDPKTRLNLVLSHLGKKYGLTPPSGSGAAGANDGKKTALTDVGSFVQNMMGGPKTTSPTTSPTVTSPVSTSGEFVGGLGDLLGDLGSAIFHHPHAHVHEHAYGHERFPMGFGVEFPWGRRPSYPAYATPSYSVYPQMYSQYPEQPYAQQQGYAQPPVTHARPVTYRPYPMPQPQQAQAKPKKWSAWAMEVGPMTVTHPDEPKMIQVSASSPRKGTGIGKFVSKMMGGPGSHAKATPDEDLRKVQHTLNEYYATKVLAEDGIMGDETHRILKWFQKSNGLPETGNPDPGVMLSLSKGLSDRAVSQGLTPVGDAGNASADASDWLSRGPFAQDVTGWTGWG